MGWTLEPAEPLKGEECKLGAPSVFGKGNRDRQQAMGLRATFENRMIKEKDLDMSQRTGLIYLGRGRRVGLN